MAVGLGSLKKKTETKSTNSGKSAKSEAEDILKKMDAKADAGDCPFC